MALRDDEDQACQQKGGAEAEHLPVVGIAEDGPTATRRAPGDDAEVQENDKSAGSREQRKQDPAGTYGDGR